MAQAKIVSFNWSERPASKTDVEHGALFAPLFDSNGLIPAIVADASNGDVLMFAWMNDLALQRTLETGEGHFWSRSRGKLWRKGEESGNVLKVVELAVDCDQDVLLMRANLAGAGAACHTGVRSCFYRKIVTDEGGKTRLAER